MQLHFAQKKTWIPVYHDEHMITMYKDNSCALYIFTMQECIECKNA